MNGVAHEDSSTESTFKGISVRAWIATFLVLGVIFQQTIIILAQIYYVMGAGEWSEIVIKEPMYSLVLIAVGYYFGNKNGDKPKGV